MQRPLRASVCCRSPEQTPGMCGREEHTSQHIYTRPAAGTLRDTSSQNKITQVAPKPYEFITGPHWLSTWTNITMEVNGDQQ